MLKVRIADICKNLSNLADYEQVNRYDLDTLDRLQSEKSTIADIKNSLKTLMRMLYAVYEKGVILLIDEYDVPLANASEKDNAKNHFYLKMLDIIKGLMSIALKDNEFLQFAVVTGCLRIARESIFTGTNNFTSYSVLDEDFSEYFGFSAKDVSEMLIAADQLDKAEIIKNGMTDMSSEIVMSIVHGM